MIENHIGMERKAVGTKTKIYERTTRERGEKMNKHATTARGMRMDKNSMGKRNALDTSPGQAPVSCVGKKFHRGGISVSCFNTGAVQLHDRVRG
jgi:hypothetical protein